MRPLKLVVTNFASYEKAEIDLSSLSLVGITGTVDGDSSRSNGSGKTTIFRAILWVLFNRFGLKGGDSVTNDDFVRRGAKKAEVTFSFEKDGSVYKVTRGWSGKSTLEIWRGENLLCNNVRTGDAVIQTILGLDCETFLATSFFAQEQADTFTSARPAQRKAYLRTILDLDVFERARQRCSQRLTALQQSIGEIRAKIEQEESGIPDDDDAEALMFGIEEAEKGVKDLSKELVSLREEQKEWEGQQAQAQERATLEASIAGVKARIESLTSLICVISEDLASVQEKGKKSSEELNGLRFFRLNGKATEMEASLRNLLASKKDEAPTDRAKGLRGAKDEADNHVLSCMSRIDDVRGKLAKISSVTEGACPTCENPVTGEHKAKVTKELEETLAQLQENMDDWAFQWSTASVSLDQEVENHRTGLDGKIAEIERSLSDLREKQRENDRVQIRKEFLDIAITGSIIQTKEFDGRRRVEEERLASARVQLESLSKRLSEMPLIHPTLRSRSRDIDMKEGELRTLEKQKQEYQSRVDDWKGREKRAKALRAGIEKSAHEADLYTALVRAFGKDGVIAFVIEGALSEITKQANTVLEEIGTPMCVQFKTVKETKAGDEKDSLDIVVLTTDGECPYEVCSGGERTLLNFAIRFSLSWWLSSRTGSTIDSVFLDEVFESLDEAGRDAIARQLNILKKRFKFIAAISHMDLKDYFPSTIHVVKENGVSRIEEAVQ